MGLFNRSNVSREIYDHTKIVLDDFSQNISMFDCNGACEFNNLLTMVGFLSYYIAGTTKAKYATQVINLFCDEFVSDDRKQAEELIQEYYFRARRMSDALMKYGQGLSDILDAHAESLCVLNDWEVTEHNKFLFSSILANYYQYLTGVK